MKKKDFVTLILTAVGSILFALGMCMALLPQWGVTGPGVLLGIAGMVTLLAMVFIRRKMEGKPLFTFNGKTVGTVLLGLLGALTLGAGMCMTMVWGMMIPGIIVGIVGIAVLLCLFPVIKGFEYK